MEYKQIYRHYENCLDKYGDNHRGVDWPNKEDVDKRFNTMLSIINDKNKNIKLLDFGCGCGELLTFIRNKKIENLEYYGLDISKKFIDLCKKKFPDTKFYCVDIIKDNISFLPKFDYVIINGVFTEKINLSHEEMFTFFSIILKTIFLKTNVGIAFNTMSPIVDFKRDDLFYLSHDELGKFLHQNLTRNYIINNNYQLWECTTFVYK